jgi:hypothetical protein
MSYVSKVALIAAATSLITGCTWVDHTFNTNFTGSGGAHQAAASTATATEQAAAPKNNDGGTFEQAEVVDAVSDFFGITAASAAALVDRAFKDNGRPTGYIRGEEVAAAVGVGVRYGEGDMTLKNGQTRHVFWQGPSVGFDSGANASKVFTLVYGMQDSDSIYQRFPGVEGAAYLVGGVGVTYQRADDITLAPMRAGVGLRAGANVGYLSYSRERSILPL